MLSGDNGILQKATDVKEQTGIGQEKEIIALAYNSVFAKKIGSGDTTPINDSELRNELSNYSEIDSVAMNDEDIVVTFKSNRSYLVKSNGEISKQNNINISSLVVKNGTTEVIDGSKSVEPSTPLTINFIASITEGSIASITPSIPYTTNGTETSKTFTITGSNGTVKEYTVNLRGYYNIPNLKVGDFVKYELNALDSNKVTALDSDVNTYSGKSGQTISRSGITTENGKDYLLCRVLEMDSNGNPTKLISAIGVNKLSLKGADGYNNAVYLIEGMCKTLYTGNKGTTASLKIDDLENDYFSQTAIDIRNSSSGSGVIYGQTKYYSGNYYSGNAKYPTIATVEAGFGIGTTLLNEKNQIREGGLHLSEQIETYVGSGNASNLEADKKGITVPQTAYSIRAGDSNYTSAVLNNIIHDSPMVSESDYSNFSSYWLASRCVQIGADYCFYRVRSVSMGGVDSNNMYDSYGNSNGYLTCSLRPVINLQSENQAEYSAKYNDTYNLWNLK